MDSRKLTEASADSGLVLVAGDGGCQEQLGHLQGVGTPEGELAQQFQRSWGLTGISGTEAVVVGDDALEAHIKAWVIDI